MKKFFISKHIKNTRNYMLTLIFFFISLAILLSLTIAVTFTIMANNTLNNNLTHRTIKVNGSASTSDPTEDFINLGEINHVETVEDAIYGDPIISEVKEFDIDIKGELILYPMLNNNFDIVKGRKINNNGEAVCSSLFYPYVIELDDRGKTIFNKNRILDPNKVLNMNFKIASQKNVWQESKEEEKIIDFKIVGFYDFNTNNTELNACYISKEDFYELHNPYQGATSTLQEDGTWNFIPDEYQGKILIVDNVKNVKYVLEELNKRNLTYIANDKIGLEFTIVTLVAPIIIFIILIIAFIIILRSFISKKIKDNCKNYAILKSLGYSKKEIISTSITENIILLTFSVILNLIVYPFIFYYIKYVALQEYIYDGTIVNFSIWPVITSILVVYIITIITNKKILERKLDSSISEILR